MKSVIANFSQGEGLMNRVIAALLLSFLLMGNVYAASWTKLQDNKHAILMLDKQSIAESSKYQKAWVKMEYKSTQINLEYPDKQYNNAKLLWYFNCKEQKAASVQVYQLLDDEQVFSAAIDVKRARFIEPVPETEIDLAMRYVCKQKASKEAAAIKKLALEDKAKAAPVEKSKEVKVGEPAVIKEASVNVEKTNDKKGKQIGAEKDVAEITKNNKKDKKSKHDAKDKEHDKGEAKKAKKAKKAKWKYKGKNGPEFWGELSPDYANCKAGRNQSPIDIAKTTITAANKSLKTFQRFPAKDIRHNGHTIQASFKPGNMMAVDGVMYQMKEVQFHAPSEHMIDGKAYPLEAHFLHADPKDNLAVLAVMFEEGAESKSLAKLWKQMPKRKSSPKKLKTKVLASDLIPMKKQFYRFSGSLTTPPCSEGVIWVVMKVPMTASKSQIDAFKKIIGHGNNRPIQPLNGRIVIE